MQVFVQNIVPGREVILHVIDHCSIKVEYKSIWLFHRVKIQTPTIPYFVTMKNYRWGIIGPGKIAHKFAVALILAGGARLEAIASRDGQRAREFAEKFNAPRYYYSYEALAKDPNIDAIYISTPHAFH